MPQIRPEEFGFNPQYSTSIKLVKFIDNITDNLNEILKNCCDTSRYRKLI